MKSSAIIKQNRQTLPLGSRFWTPANLPHLIAWNSVRTLQNLTADATTEFFYDVSGNGNAVRQTEENKRPTVKVSSDFGNLKVLDFDAGTDFMKKTPPPDSLDIDDGDFFFCSAIKAGEDDTNQTIMSLQRVDNSEELRLFLQGNGTFTFRISGDDLARATGDLEESVNLVYAERINGAMRVFVNGTVGSVQDTSTTAINNNGAVLLGSLNTTGAQLFGGQIAEIVYGGSTSKGILDDNQRQLLEGYMAHRCNISSRLVASHPYKNKPPRI